MTLAAACALIAEVVPVDARTFLDRIELDWITQAIEKTGTATVRRRRLPAEQVVWLVIGLAMMRGRSIIDVVDKLSLALSGPSDNAVVPSAVAQARQRLGSAPMKELFQVSAGHWGGRAQTPINGVI